MRLTEVPANHLFARVHGADNALVVEVGPVQRLPDRPGCAQANGAPEQRSEHVRHRPVLETDLEGDDHQAEHDAEERVDDRSTRQRRQLEGRVAYRSNTKKAGEQKPGHE